MSIEPNPLPPVNKDKSTVFCRICSFLFLKILQVTNDFQVFLLQLAVVLHIIFFCAIVYFAEISFKNLQDMTYIFLLMSNLRWNCTCLCNFQKVDPTPYLEACKLDCCGGGDATMCGCKSFEAYARACKDASPTLRDLDWRSDQLCRKLRNVYE